MTRLNAMISVGLMMLAVECNADTLVLSPVQASSDYCVLEDDGLRPDPAFSVCDTRFSIELPVGKIVDGVEVGYWYDINNNQPLGNDHVDAQIWSNAYKVHNLSTVSLLTSYTPPSPYLEYFLQVHPTGGSFSIDKWTTYEVSIEPTLGIRVDGVTVTYH